MAPWRPSVESQPVPGPGRRSGTGRRRLRPSDPARPRPDGQRGAVPSSARFPAKAALGDKLPRQFQQVVRKARPFPCALNITALVTPMRPHGRPPAPPGGNLTLPETLWFPGAVRGLFLDLWVLSGSGGASVGKYLRVPRGSRVGSGSGAGGRTADEAGRELQRSRAMRGVDPVSAQFGDRGGGARCGWLWRGGP